MKRWMGWMLVGSMALGGAAFAQNEGEKQPSEERSGQKETGTQNGTDDTQGMFRMGEAEAIDQGEGLKDATGGVQGTGGSGQGGAGMQAQGAKPDAQGAKMMDQGLLPIPTDEQTYLGTLHHSNQMEVQLGQLAQQKGVSKGVKDFGARLVKDHQAADQKLMTYAQTKNLQLGEPKEDDAFQKTMKNADQAAMAKLQSLQGPAFDRAFLAHMVGDHDADVAKVMAGQQQFAGNTELKGQLDSLLPTLRQHRDQAYRLLGQEKPRQARMAPQGR
jgi:putative membrane protein